MVGTTAYVITSTDIQIKGNSKNRTKAFYIAEAGLRHAQQDMADDDTTDDFTALAAGTAATANPPFNNTAFGGGRYTVTAAAVAGSNPSRVKARPTGCFPTANPCPSGNSRVVIEAHFEQELGMPNEAVWSYFIRKVYETDPLVCPKCSGEMRIISFFDQAEVIIHARRI